MYENYQILGIKVKKKMVNFNSMMKLKRYQYY